jgi:hypothetical protein
MKVHEETPLHGKPGKRLAVSYDALRRDAKENRTEKTRTGNFLDASVAAHAGRAISAGTRRQVCGWKIEAQFGGPSRKFGREEWSMKTRIVGLLVLATLILAFTFIATAPAAPNKANVPATPAVSALPATPAAAPAERHPEIREALEALRRAKEHMEHAAHDFGGHRVEAIEATDRAIKQLELCLKYDRD